MPDGDDAFISYSHAADDRLAPALERGLERLARPWNRLRAVSVFRDQSDLSLNPDLWATISGRLDSSRFLVLLACPESAASIWVNREVAHWCESKGTEYLLLVWTGGELAWDDATRDFTTGSSAIPDGLRGRFTDEPLYLDLRWARHEPELTLKQSRFRTAVAQVAAPIRGMPPDELEGEDIRLHKRAQRLARGAVAALVVLSVLATIAAVIAVSNAHRADQRTREAIAHQVGLAALDLPTTELDQALLMSLVSGELAPNDDPQRFQPTQVLIGRYSRLRTMLHLSGNEGFVTVRGIGLSPDGTVIYATAGRADGSIALATWPRSDTPEAQLAALPLGAGSRVDVIDGGAQVIVGADGSQALRGDVSGDVVPIPGTVLEADRWSEVAWLTNPDDSLSIVSLADRHVLASVSNADGAIVDIGPHRAAVLVDNELTTFDVTTGDVQSRANDAPPGLVIAAGSSDAASVVEATTDGNILRWARTEDRLVVDASLATPSEIGRPTWLAVSPGGERALVVGTTGAALVEFGSDSVVLAPGGGATVAEADPSGRFVALGGSRLSVWDLETGHRAIAIPEVSSALAWSGPCDRQPRCKLVASGVSIDIVDPIAETQTRLATEIGAQTVAISGDGSIVVSSGWGATIAVWSVEPIVDDSTRRQLADGEGPGQQPSGTTTSGSATNPDCRSGLQAVSPDGSYVVAIDPSSAVTSLCRTGDAGPRIAVAALKPDAGTVTAVAVDDQGSVALGRATGVVEYYPVADGKFQRGSGVDVRVGGEQVEISALAARGGVVVAGIRFPTSSATPSRVMIWRLAQQESTTFATDYADVASVAVLDAAAGAVIVAGRDTQDGPVTVQVWGTVSRRRIGRAFTGLEGDVVALRGLDVAIEGTDRSGRSFRWSLDQDPTREVCAIVGRSLSAEEWAAFADRVLQRYTFDPPCD